MHGKRCLVLKLKVLVGSIFGGVVITLLTGLLSNTPTMMVGAVHFGYPLPWLIRLVVAPQYYPWRVNELNFIADCVLWSVITGVLLLVLERMKRG